MVSLLSIIALCFIVQIAMAQPADCRSAERLHSEERDLTNKEMLYVAIGIIGATVMPHNLYLHSSIVQTRAYERNDEGRREAIRWATVDSTVALMLALFVNAAILIVAARRFPAKAIRCRGNRAERTRCCRRCSALPLLRRCLPWRCSLRAINSTVTATLAGQIVMEGFLGFEFPIGRAA